MAERNPFDQQPKGAREDASRELRCEEWESLLADALDGLLPAADSAAFSSHSAGCAGCAQLLTEAKQGQEWLKFLEAEPELPADLMERILSKTSGAVADRPLAVFGAPIPAGGPTVLGMPMRRMVWDTRLMMTAAMAFFSIALTLNLAGVRITELRLSSFTPANLENNISRQFWQAKIQVVKYYSGLRFVYEVESKMREFRQDEETTPPPSSQPVKEEKPQANPPAGQKTGGKVESIPNVVKPDIMWGHPALAFNAEKESNPSCPRPRDGRNEIVSGNRKEVKTLVVLGLDQAERSLA
jgi:Putative zinc-finger